MLSWKLTVTVCVTGLFTRDKAAIQIETSDYDLRDFNAHNLDIFRTL